MNNLLYRIALEHIESSMQDDVSSFHKILKMVKDNKIKNKDDFFSQLEDINIDKIKFKNIVKRIIDSGTSEEISELVSTLGSDEGGLQIFSGTWVQRQFEDDELIRRIKPKFWHLFRNKEWLNKEQEGIGKHKSN